MLVQLLAARMALMGLTFRVFGVPSMGERTAKGRAEGHGWASFLTIVPRFGPREHFTDHGWRYRQLFVLAWMGFLACGVAVTMTPPNVMNDPAP